MICSLLQLDTKKSNLSCGIIGQKASKTCKSKGIKARKGERIRGNVGLVLV